MDLEASLMINLQHWIFIPSQIETGCTNLVSHFLKARGLVLINFHVLASEYCKRRSSSPISPVHTCCRILVLRKVLCRSSCSAPAMLHIVMGIVKNFGHQEAVNSRDMFKILTCYLKRRPHSLVTYRTSKKSVPQRSADSDPGV